LWVSQVEQYRDLTMKVINQTERRVIQKESVHSSEKIVSLFESHTDIIVKGFRDVQYGHKMVVSQSWPTQCADLYSIIKNTSYRIINDQL
jgi:hypothetical protein